MPVNACCQMPLAAGGPPDGVLPFDRHETAGTFFANLLNTSDFPARWYCGTWNAELGWLHIISDLGIFGAYTAIPLVIAYFILRRKDMPFPAILWLFVSFIMFCGLGHLVEAFIFWYPVYRLSGLVKALTAAISWFTVFALIRIIPKALELPRIAALNEQLTREIEERKKAQAEIAKLSLVASKSRHGVVITNAQGEIEWVNDGFSSLTGYTFEEVLGRRPGSFLQGEKTNPETVCMIAKCLSRKEPVSAEIVNYNKAGRDYWISLEVEPVFDDDGNFLQFVGTQVDITERKRINQALCRSNARFEALLKSDIVGIVVAETDGSIVSANNEFLRISGYTRGDLETTGLNWLAMTAPEYRAAAEKAIEELETEGSAKPWRNEYLQKNGNRVPVLIGTAALPEDPGMCLGLVLDMTQQQAIEHNLHEARRTAEYANEAKSNFLANMSHEIRTPLNAIMGFTELLASGQVREHEQKEHYRTILDSSQHLLTLINDILDLSKVESGHMDFDLAWCSPHTVVGEVVSVLRVRAHEKRLQLEGCWQGAIPESIHTDPLRIRQLLMNLVGNAIKFTDSGLVRILTCVERQSGTEGVIQIEVQDSGIGIAPENLERIFAPFTQADTSITRNFGGTGLGLAISKRIVEGLGGTISVQSQPGRGSVFSVRLPCGLSENDVHHTHASEAIRSRRQTELPAPGQAGPPKGSIANLAHSRLLVVDDGVTNRKLISLMLRKAGATVDCVENGQEALDAQEQTAYDVILMDMQMPVLDGYSATRELRQRGVETPVIALTAHAMRGDREKCLEAGCTDFLSKPVDRDHLCWLVAKFLEQRDTHVPGTELTEPEDDGEYQSGPGLESVRFSAGDTVVFEPVRVNCVTSLPVDEEFREIIQEFVEGLPARFTEIDAAITGQRFHLIAELAHSLKGSAAMIGFEEFSQLAARLEVAAKQRAVADLKRHCDELKLMATRLEVPACEEAGVES